MSAIVVGVSPTSGSPRALRWAATEAQLRRLPMIAVLAWRTPRAPAAPAGRPQPSIAVLDDPAVRAEQQLREFVESALGSDAEVECRAVHGSAVNALLSAAEGAELLVVGEPDPGRLGNVRTGLVAPSVVLRAPCPVVVMPATPAG